MPKPWFVGAMFAGDILARFGILFPPPSDRPSLVLAMFFKYVPPRVGDAVKSPLLGGFRGVFYQLDEDNIPIP